MSGFPRLDVLPAAQRALWPELAEVCRNSFVLYGGTAVVLYLGHRESIDFDFFTHRERVEPKDYLDVDALMRDGLSLPSGLAGARLLFRRSRLRNA